MKPSHDATCVPSTCSDNDGHPERSSTIVPGEPTGQEPHQPRALFFFVNAYLDRPALSVLLTLTLMQSCCFRGLYIFLLALCLWCWDQKKNHLKTLKCSFSVQNPRPGRAGRPTSLRPCFGRFHRARIDFCNGLSRFCYK